MSHVDGKNWVPTSNQLALAGGEKRGLLGGNIKRRKVSRRDRVSIGFDGEDRADYLTGFKKRKDERRAIAIQEMIMKERKDRLKERSEKRKATKDMLISKGITPGVPMAAKLDTDGAGIVEEEATYESTEQLVTVTAFTLNSDDEEEEEDEEDKEEDAKAGPDHRGRRPKHMKPGTFKQKLKIPNVVGKGKNQIRLNGKGNIRKRSAQPKQRARKGERKGVGFKGSTGPTGGGSGGKDRGKKGKR